MSVPQLRLYIKSVKTVTGSVEVVSPSASLRLRWNSTINEAKVEYMLPENQETTREIIMEVASNYGLEVQVIDVGRENILHKAIQEERERIKVFPTLLFAESGERIEGEITEEQAKSFLSRIADRSRKKYL